MKTLNESAVLRLIAQWWADGGCSLHPDAMLGDENVPIRKLVEQVTGISRDESAECEHEPAPRITPPIGSPLPTCRKCGIVYMPDSPEPPDADRALIDAHEPDPPSRPFPAPNPTKPARCSDALAIQGGACNPSGIAHSIVRACREIREAGGGTDDIRRDSAVRLMVHQLAFLCNTAEIDRELSVYSDLTKACEAGLP